MNNKINHNKDKRIKNNVEEQKKEELDILLKKFQSGENIIMYFYYFLYMQGIVIDNETKRFTLEEAAQKVNISKKSLDDYLL